MLNHHIAYVPIKWSMLPIKTLRFVIELEIIANFYRENKIEGTVVCLKSTVTVLERHQNHIWLKRDNDARTSPYHNDYIAILVSCILPGP
ncbi:GSCOCT00014221001.2-RA-CDS [Cotesia congregata]|uniref:Cc_bv6.6_29.16 n=2 Tax=root TaxID=1 RepID=S6D9J9_COTCN|nr:GSCOCT00014221001.2-RA-CDS [Cotesia congregata]CAG5092428.1 cc_bv6.6_29.16 [Cotesia congregata]CCB96417.1 hypothetical protein BV6-6 [Bracoviriform congregatae]CCQ71185.1 hypothetical protein BV6-6 [Cotesia congregata]